MSDPWLDSYGQSGRWLDGEDNSQGKVDPWLDDHGSSASWLDGPASSRSWPDSDASRGQWSDAGPSRGSWLDGGGAPVAPPGTPSATAAPSQAARRLFAIEAWLLPVIGGGYLAWKWLVVILLALARFAGVDYLNRLVDRWCPVHGQCPALNAPIGPGFYGGVILLLIASVMFWAMLAVRPVDPRHWIRRGLLVALLAAARFGGSLAESGLIPWL